jgi:hypothetical protein
MYEYAIQQGNVSISGRNFKNKSRILTVEKSVGLYVRTS